MEQEKGKWNRKLVDYQKLENLDILEVRVHYLPLMVLEPLTYGKVKSKVVINLCRMTTVTTIYFCEGDNIINEFSTPHKPYTCFYSPSFSLP